MIKVLLRENLRNLDDFGTDLNFTAGQEKELYERDLKSYSIKSSLYNGDLKLAEGELLIQIKHAKISLSAKHKDIAYGLEFGKFFKRDLDNQEIFWIPDSEVPNEDISLLKGEVITKEAPIEVVPEVEAPVEETLDVSNLDEDSKDRLEEIKNDLADDGKLNHSNDPEKKSPGRHKKSKKSKK